MNLLIVDTETTGLSPDKGDLLIEIGAVLYNVEHKTILQCLSTLYPCNENKVENINGIKPIATQQEMPRELIKPQLTLMLQHSDAVVAHNAQFDRGFIKTLNIEEFDNARWICTRNDFQWPLYMPRKRLQDVCESLGIPYVNAHRAIQDCFFLVDCFNRVEDLSERLDHVLNGVEKFKSVLSL